jgi:hypothetical protein
LKSKQRNAERETELKKGYERKMEQVNGKISEKDKEINEEDL